MNPAKVGEQAQNLSLPAQIALPALLANSSEQERLQAELNDQNQPHSNASPAQPPKPVESETGHFTLIPSQYGYVEFAVRLLKSQHRHARSDEGAVGKIRAEWQREHRERNGRRRTKSSMRCSAIVEAARCRRMKAFTRSRSAGRIPPAPPIGPAKSSGRPHCFRLKTVNVLAAGKTLIVFDKTNKKLWQATLTYDVPGWQSRRRTEKPRRLAKARASSTATRFMSLIRRC